MEKLEIIKKAYGEHYEQMKPFINENGWFDKNSFYNNKFDFNYEELDKSFTHKEDFMRPIELNGLDNNKGWVKIYRENDMPQFDCDCFIIDKVKGIVTGQWRQAPNEIEDKKARAFWLDKATHYKIIEKPELPLY